MSALWRGARPWILGAVAVAIFLAGLWAGRALYGPRPTAAPQKAPGFTQADGSKVLPTIPATARQARKAIPHLAMVPPGATLERAVEATLMPRPPTAVGAPVDPGANQGPAHPIRVDLALLKMPDGSERVGISSPDADVVGGMDMPTVKPPGSERGWAVGGFWNPVTHAWGPVGMKDLGPLRLAAVGRLERIQTTAGTFRNNGVDLILAVHF